MSLPSFAISAPAGQLLLQLARASIAHHLAGVPLPGRPTPHADDPAADAALDAPQGVFVSLHTRADYELRGCIGVIQSRAPLWQSVRDSAISAATRDPRFVPVEASELPGVEIEISVLSPLRRVENVADIEIGTHGLLIRHGRHSGLLLPQVALEWGFDRDAFLAHTCRKAGLAMDAWQDRETEIFSFRATIFHDAQTAPT